MAEPRLLQVGNEETTAKEKGESGLSSAQVGTEAKTVEKASEEPKGVYVANENVVSDNSKALRTSKEAPKGQYVAPTERLGGFERSAGEKGVVNTITVDEVKALIKQYGGGGDTYTKEEIDHIVETMRKGLYQEVDTTEYPTLEDFLDSDGEEGIIYLYPVGNEGNNYYQYIWETTKEWISLGTTVVDLSQYAKLTLLAPIYDSTATYSVGAKCIYNGKLYTCSTAITQAEDFDATHWTEISVSSSFVDLDSAQTITGTKIHTGDLKAVNLLSKFNDNTGLNLGTNDIIIKWSGGIYLIGRDIIPQTDNNVIIGSSTKRVKDLYLSGKIKDGTNEFNADNVFNVINASDMFESGNTLKQTAYDLITNGKPTIIKGTFKSREDVILYKEHISGSYYCFSALTNQGLEFIVLNITSQSFPENFRSGIRCVGNDSYMSNLVTNLIQSKDWHYYLNNTGHYKSPTVSNNTVALDYIEISNISVNADTTITLTALSGNYYPEYKANITNSGASDITITLPSGTVIKGNVSISSKTFVIPAGSTVEVNIQNGKALVVEW